MTDTDPFAVPDRIAIDANGYGWRVWDNEEYWSMVPTNPDNGPIPQPVTWFVTAAQFSDIDNGPMLSDDEREALSLTAKLAQVCMKVIGKGPSAEHDWAEMAHRIHDIQHALMSNAAARAYPDTFRLLGGTLARVEAVGQP